MPLQSLLSKTSLCHISPLVHLHPIFAVAIFSVKINVLINAWKMHILLLIQMEERLVSNVIL